MLSIRPQEDRPVDHEGELLDHLRSIVSLKSVSLKKSSTDHSGRIKWAYLAGYEDLVLKKGRFWLLPNTRNARPVGIRKMRDGLCFQNAFCLAERKKFKYIEGYAIGVIPVLHAWCVDEEGFVIDPTWKTLGEAYFGIEIPPKTVWKHIRKTKHYGILASDFMNSFSILKRGL